MCGIAGLVTTDPAVQNDIEATIAAMADTLTHRGPDGHGASTFEHARVGLGHRRLAVIDLSEHGRQPMTSRSGRWVVSFNGEIYNHRVLRSDLERAGTRFRGHSDTETLVEAVDQWGLTETLERANGMFALAAYDTTRRRLTLARDRLGEKPLYWFHDGHTVAFGSELRALRTIAGTGLTVDPAAATALLRWSYIPHPHTIYAGVRQLPPGGLLHVDVDGHLPVVTEAAWWSVTDAIATALDERTDHDVDTAVEELHPLLTDAISLRLESDVPLGAFLSGGIDSSLVAALARQVAPGGRLRTFTVSMPHLGFDESAHAATVARHLGSDHVEVELTLHEALDEITRLPTIWDEPFADPSMLPTALLCRAARSHLTVCLGGDGGDELFAGYNRHALGASLHRRMGRLPGPLRRGLGRAALLPSPALVDRANRLLPPRRRLPNLGDKVQKAGAMLHDDGTAWEALAGIWPAEHLGPRAHPPTVRPLDGLDPVEQMMLVDTVSVLPDQMLVKVDRASMATALEVRVPLLDHRLLEWAWRQPTTVKTAGGVGKLVLRQLAAQVLPAEIVERPKMGFDPPLGDWLRHELTDWAGDLLAAPRAVAEGWIGGDALRRTWDEHLDGRRNREYPLWGVLMLEAWLTEHHGP